jgi:hypothetical protein
MSTLSGGGGEGKKKGDNTSKAVPKCEGLREEKQVRGRTECNIVVDKNK